MPHVIVKLWPGKRKSRNVGSLKRSPQDIAVVLSYGDESVSVAMEEVTPAEWSEKVYHPDIVEKAATLYPALFMKEPISRVRLMIVSEGASEGIQDPAATGSRA